MRHAGYIPGRGFIPRALVPTFAAAASVET
jgi:hypothetical protein